MSTSPPTSDQPIGDARVRVLSGTSARAVFLLCVLWSLFQVYVASSIPFWLSSLTGISLVFNNQEVRQLHLAFGLVLAMLLHPLGKNSAQPIPWYDILLALLGASSCLYLLVFKDSIADRAGLPTTSDLIISTIGLCCLGLAVYRALGLPLLVVAGVFLSYVFFGDKSFIPEVIQWKGASLNKALWHFWMQTEGVFGVALGVSSSMIFLFVLFGALLERAGAGQYFIQLAFALLGHFRGGPAKAAVVASGLSGLYSGSSIANVVTTGTFTIPLMKKTGFTAEKAGAVEVASSTNGQLTPPVMGAAAFLIAEFTGT
ncbi:MAG: TRAP transporter permease, partial [bacterium]